MLPIGKELVYDNKTFQTPYELFYYMSKNKVSKEDMIKYYVSLGMKREEAIKVFSHFVFIE